MGTNVAVLCLPSDPDVSRLVDDNTSAVQMYAFAFGGAVLLAGAIAITIVVIVMPMRV